jgi:hypothetical protein
VFADVDISRAKSFQFFSAIVDKLFSFGFPGRVLNECPDVSEEHTAFIFRLTLSKSSG